MQSPRPAGENHTPKMAKYGINGFGRIGRNVVRAMTQEQIERIAAINDLTDNKTLAHLLKWDSTAGPYDGEVEYDDEHISIRGHKIRVFAERDPANLPWGDLGAEVVLESTGFFTKRPDASKHLASGAKKVLISAPAGDPDLTMCLGINDDQYDPANHHIVSNASCTTNCLAPIAKVLHDNYTITEGIKDAM